MPRRKPSALPLTLALAAGGFVLLVGGGVALYFLVFAKGGAGLPGLGPPLAIAYANVRPTDGPLLPDEGAGAVDVEVKFTGRSDGDLYVVVRSHYAMKSPGRAAKIPPEAAAQGRFLGRLPDGGLPESPYDVWLEKRTGGMAEKVSNMITEQDGWPKKK